MRAVARGRAVPGDRVGRGGIFGAEVVVPSSLNCTPATPTLSEAVAETVTAVPETVAPLAGVVRETVGGVVSGADVPPSRMNLCDGRDAAPVQDEEQVVARRRNTGGGRCGRGRGAVTLRPPVVCEKLSSLMYWLWLKA